MWAQALRFAKEKAVVGIGLAIAYQAFKQANEVFEVLSTVGRKVSFDAGKKVSESVIKLTQKIRRPKAA